MPTWIGALALKAAYRLHRPTTVIMNAMGSFDEMRAFCRDILAEAKRQNVTIPRLEAAKSYYDRQP